MKIGAEADTGTGAEAGTGAGAEAEAGTRAGTRTGTATLVKLVRQLLPLGLNYSDR